MDSNESMTETTLTDRRRSMFRRAEFLPGFDAFVSTRSDISTYIADKWRLVEAAVRDDDIVRFEGAAADWLAACHRVNELLAEAYQKEHPDPETWELRYVKWMKIAFIRCESPRGEFFIVPRRPRRRPKAKHWYTVDELIGMMQPGVVALLGITDKLPMRPEDLPGPRPGEKHLVMDFTGPEYKTHYVFGREPRWRNGTS